MTAQTMIYAIMHQRAAQCFSAMARQARENGDTAAYWVCEENARQWYQLARWAMQIA